MQPDRKGDLVRATIIATLCTLAWTSTLALDDHVFVLTRQFGIAGNSAALDIESPWAASIDLEPISHDAVVRHFFGLHYVVNKPTGEIQVIDPETFETVARYSVGAASSPQDIAVVGKGVAYVSRYDSCDLLKIDPADGAPLANIDLCFLADADGLPEMAMMALDGNHLFVQIQRLDRATETPVLPSYLAVVDTTSDQVIQTIELTGSRPSFKMHVDSDARRLYVSEPGLVFDPLEGGIDEIDLDNLQALGFVASESSLQTLDIGPFVMVSPTKGYVVSFTDFAAITHVGVFSRQDGSNIQTVYNANGIFRSLGYDPETQQVFLPDSDGVHVFDARTDTQLTTKAIGTGLMPDDFVVARVRTPGEAMDLIVEDFDHTTGVLRLTYRPGCAAPDHHVVIGELDDVATYGYSNAVCGIGNSGTFETFSPGSGSYFFLVIANDGASGEGSYGTDSAQQERPEDLNDPACAFVRDLSLRCDN